MKGVALVLGLLLLLGGGAVAGAQYAPVDLSLLDAYPSGAQAREFLTTQNALYAGAGAAALGLTLFIVGVLPGKKKAKASAPVKMTRPMTAETKPAEAKPVAQPAPAPLAAAPVAAAPVTPPPRPVAPPAAPVAAPIAAPVAEAPKPAPTPPPAPQPVAQAAPAPAPTPAPALAPAAAPAAAPEPPKPATPDPRILARKRISDLVTVNDAIKAFHAKTGAYPVAQGLQGAPDRGGNWVPGLAPDYLTELPVDPLGAPDNNGPQYYYVSDGSGYKLIVHGVSADGANVEVLGVKIDPARRNETGFWAYGFWTEGFAAI
jgi:hypothetical protein